jgi:hypothetical protein
VADDQHKEWYALLKSSKTALNAGRWELRLAYEPSFEDHRVIGVQPVTRRFPDRLREHGYDVVARTWRMSTDSTILESPIQRAKHPHPFPATIDERRVPIDRPTLNVLLQELDRIVIPVFPMNPPAGLDGIGYELSAGGHFAETTLRWWCMYPKRWQSLIEWWLAAWNTLADIASLPSDQRPSPSELTPHE